MKTSLFSESLFTLPLDAAIDATKRAGFDAIELACKSPHFDLETARRDAPGVAQRIESEGLKVAALSLYNNFTDPAQLDAHVEAATTFLRLAPLFQTAMVKLTPGPPGSAAATPAHWASLETAIQRLVPVAQEVGVRLAFETHMRQLTDTLASSRRLLEIAPSRVVGLTVDFSNLSFAGEPMPEAFAALKDRMYHVHLKNGTIDESGGWCFQALDQGLTDYRLVLRALREARYEGYFSLECLGLDARREPERTATRDLQILRQLWSEIP
jgi:L-ribulose-5-phosphate 3-epimerase